MTFTIIFPTPKYIEQFVFSGLIAVSFEKILEFEFVIPQSDIEQVILDRQKIYFGLYDERIDICEDIFTYKRYLKPFLLANDILDKEKFFVKKYPEICYFDSNGLKCEIDVSLNIDETVEIDEFKKTLLERE